MEEDLKKSIRRALATRFGVRAKVEDVTGLFSGGFIDSLNVVELVTFVEEQIGCAIPPTDITLENFDSIDRIVRYARKLNGAEGGA